MTTIQLDVLLTLAALTAFTISRSVPAGWRGLLRFAGTAAVIAAGLVTVAAADRAQQLGMIAVTSRDLLIVADAYLLVAVVLLVVSVGGRRS